LPVRILRWAREPSPRFLCEWLLFLLVSIAISVALTHGRTVGALDKLIYDWWMQNLSRPASQDIIIVEIDNRSLEQIGRWPWRRDYHAAALRRIAAAKPRCVIYDVVFSEPSNDDRLLAAAMSLTKVYLPVIVETSFGNGRSGRAIMPVDELRQAAAGLGHINLEADRDGIVRRVALFEGAPQQMWPQLALSAYAALGASAAKLPRMESEAKTRAGLALPLLRSRPVLIPFPPHLHPYPRVSFADLIAGRVGPELLRDKIVIVGATADGLQEHLTTSVSSGYGTMPGVEVHAAILDGLLNHSFIAQPRRWLAAGLSTIPVILLFLGLLLFAPNQSIIILPCLVALSFVTSGAALKCHLWIAPSSAIVTILGAYPLWSWRRLKVAMLQIGAELEHLATEPHLVHNRLLPPRLITGSALDRNIALMRHAAGQLRDLHRFISDSINSLPDPVLVADLGGRIQLANHPAQHYLGALIKASLGGQSLQRVLGELTFVRPVGTQLDTVRQKVPQWPDILTPADNERIEIMTRGIEVRDAAGQQFVLRYSRCANTQNLLIGWIANLTDITRLHAAQRQRDEMMHLLSHDMRSPQSSIIALLNIERPKVNLTEVHLVYDRIERYARRALALADSFVQLAAAESREYILEALDFTDVLYAAVDEVWPIANAKRIEIAFDVDEGEYPVLAERSMVARALINLLNNATKYSPPDTVITCVLKRLANTEGQLECVIRDRGYGIAPDQQARLFERFQRMRIPGQPDSEGVGLGLTFVRTVVLRHGGTIQCDSTPGVGTSMIIRLPCVAPIDIAIPGLQS
jgi:CHASE2 domain-containing sensor protein/signal transduction histidine kinase